MYYIIAQLSWNQGDPPPLVAYYTLQEAQEWLEANVDHPDQYVILTVQEAKED